VAHSSSTAICVFIFLSDIPAQHLSFREKTYFYIPTGSTYADVLKGLKQQHIVRNVKDFDWLARKLGYPHHVHPGRYAINPGMSNLQLVHILYSGKQAPVRLVITKLRTKADLIRLVSHHLEADSLSMATLLSDEIYLRQYGLDTNTALCAIIPNTYFSSGIHRQKDFSNA